MVNRPNNLPLDFDAVVSKNQWCWFNTRLCSGVMHLTLGNWFHWSFTGLVAYYQITKPDCNRSDQTGMMHGHTVSPAAPTHSLTQYHKPAHQVLVPFSLCCVTLGTHTVSCCAASRDDGSRKSKESFGCLQRMNMGLSWDSLSPKGASKWDISCSNMFWFSSWWSIAWKFMQL